MVWKITSEDEKLSLKKTCIQIVYLKQAILKCIDKTLADVYHLNLTNKPWIPRIQEQHDQKTSLASIQFLETQKEIEKILKENQPSYIEIFEPQNKITYPTKQQKHILKTINECHLLEKIDEEHKNDLKIIKELLEYTIQNEQNVIIITN